MLYSPFHSSLPFDRAVIDIADIDVSIKMSFDIRIDTEKGHIDIVK